MTLPTVVVGAGVIGLAVARALARAGHEVLILEAEPRFGTAISARNSEVIHAGIYYPQGSLKADLCVAGRHLLYEFCASHGIAHRRCGKLIVATEADEAGALERLRTAAHANGAAEVDWAGANDIEPGLRCAAALISPETGIIDAQGLMLALLGEAEDAGAMIATRTAVERIAQVPAGLVVETSQGPVDARCVVNAAGHGAARLASTIERLSPALVPRIHLAKGTYFALTGRAPFSRLVYPAPVDGGLGIHMTLDLAGQARFGPDVEWVDTEDYTVDPARAAAFYAAIRRYWPALPDGALQPAYAGIRPKLSGPGEPPADFRIDGPQVHGIPGLVNLFGIESPGLTACLAIADHVRALVDD